MFIAAALGLPLIGCATRPTVFEIINYRGPGVVERFHQTFTEAYYDIDGHGNVDVVLRVESPTENGAGGRIVQLIHLRTFWRSVPGVTVADRTQLNGTVTYCVISPSLVSSFEGAGSVFCSKRRGRDELTGEVELARLTPCKVVAGGDPLFVRSELSGTFSAVRDPRRVTVLVNEIERVFGSQ